MERRLLTFIVASTAFFMFYLSLRMMFAPPMPPPGAKLAEEAAERLVDEAEKAEDQAETKVEADPTADEAAPEVRIHSRTTDLLAPIAYTPGEHRRPMESRGPAPQSGWIPMPEGPHVLIVGIDTTLALTLDLITGGFGGLGWFVRLSVLFGVFYPTCAKLFDMESHEIAVMFLLYVIGPMAIGLLTAILLAAFF